MSFESMVSSNKSSTDPLHSAIDCAVEEATWMSEYHAYVRKHDCAQKGAISVSQALERLMPWAACHALHVTHTRTSYSGVKARGSAQLATGSTYVNNKPSRMRETSKARNGDVSYVSNISTPTNSLLTSPRR